jgi:CubicO group peptidase (beta-lactamase class C family)
VAIGVASKLQGPNEATRFVNFADVAAVLARVKLVREADFYYNASMTRRRFIQSGLAAGVGRTVAASLRKDRLEAAVEVLNRASRGGEVAAAVLHVVQRDDSFTHAFGKAREDSMFLLGSISKPICVTALMTLFDRGEFKLSDRLHKFIPEFKGDDART